MSKRQRLIRYARGPVTAAHLLDVLFPDVAPEHRDYILWEWTGFPYFWDTPDAIACLVSQLLNVRRALWGRSHSPLEGWERNPRALLAPPTRSER